jgi:hypothetical protein
MADILRSSRERLFAGLNEPIYMESNPLLFGFLDVLDEVFDNPLILHVVRDSRTYIRSYIHFGIFRGLKWFATSYSPLWMLKPEHCRTPSGRAWRRLSDGERIAWYWAAVNLHLNRGGQVFGERYLRMHFEDLFARDGSGLHRLVGWIGVPWTPTLLDRCNSQKINASPDMGFPKWTDWNDKLKQRVLDLCGELMQIYGYPLHAPEEVRGDTDQRTSCDRAMA